MASMAITTVSVALLVRKDVTSGECRIFISEGGFGNLGESHQEDSKPTAYVVRFIRPNQK